ncbi:hypothetical protein P7K49_009525 [Saguinus oedipus]|uniref:Uncharacterized protein n=1 Tax=Saguinus oedipus TaxID=9490 RepID=A0ABQ9VLL7_SAGOE|nr:hypothetical protein P7K49_009525 [Saguinus oedipus]
MSLLSFFPQILYLNPAPAFLLQEILSALLTGQVPPASHDTFVELYGNNAAAESRKGQERFNRWFLTGMTVAGVVLLGSLFSRK